MPNTREKLIELIRSGRRKAEDICNRNDDCERCTIADPDGNCKALYIADHLIAHGVTVQKWISVKDRLPKGNRPGEISENVIVRTTDGEVTTGWLDALGSDKWWLVIGTDDSHTCWGLGYVTHWMPLPQPPKGE